MSEFPKADLLPAITEENAPYWQGLNEGALRLQRCTQCGEYQHPPESFCYGCGSADLAWSDTSGLGAVHTFITVHQRYHPAFAADLPYNVSVVELDEGPRLIANVVGIPPDQVQIGMRVRVSPQPVAEGQRALYFERAE